MTECNAAHCTDLADWRITRDHAHLTGTYSHDLCLKCAVLQLAQSECEGDGTSGEILKIDLMSELERQGILRKEI